MCGGVCVCLCVGGGGEIRDSVLIFTLSILLVNSTLLMLKEPFQEDSTVTDPTNNCIMMCRDALNSSDAINTVFDIKKLLLLGTVITIMV